MFFDGARKALCKGSKKMHRKAFSVSICRGLLNNVIAACVIAAFTQANRMPCGGDFTVDGMKRFCRLAENCYLCARNSQSLAGNVACEYCE